MIEQWAGWSGPWRGTYFTALVLFNLNLDPKEEHAFAYEYQHFWVRFPIGKVMTDYMKSLQKYPPVPPGAPDPYVPPAVR